MKYIKNSYDEITKEDFGGKAYWLAWLQSNGYNIPKSFFLQTKKIDEIQNVVYKDSFCKELNEIINSEINSFAIRSSCVNEDGIQQSSAGVYDSFLNVIELTNIQKAIIDVVKSGKGNSMGVVIQEMINPIYSGVIFSSNPNDGNKNELLISYVKGLGENLVSGESKSINIVCKKNNEEYILEDSNIHDLLIVLSKISKEIENKLHIPVDIEWCINEKNELILLQCRPITTVLFNGQSFFKINKKNIENIPKRYLTSDKVNIRILAEEENIMVSDAYVLVTDCFKESVDTSIINIEKTKYYRGYSVVVIFPKKISGKIVRAFTGDKSNVKNQITCHRYSIRSIQDHTNLLSCIENFYDVVRNEYCSCAIIIQELFDPEFTGIAKKTKDGLVIEILKGHFASKGVTPMSRYSLNSNYELISKKEVMQESYLTFAEGVKVEFETDETLVTINEETIKNIAQTFSGIMDDSIVLEFGLLKDGNSYIPYFIDYTSENESSSNSSNIEKGIISNGEIKGKVINLSMGDVSNTLDLHFHDDRDTTTNSNEKIVFVADLPSIQFIDIINKYNHKNIGFIFKDGSILCHLSVLLRENNIPAIFSNKNFEDNSIVTINTLNEDIVYE